MKLLALALVRLVGTDPEGSISYAEEFGFFLYRPWVEEGLDGLK